MRKKRARQNTISINTVPLLSVRHSKKICVHKNDSKIKNNRTVNEYSAEKKKLEPPVHHLVQIRQFHGLTNGLVVLDHLIKRGRERSSSNLEQVSPRQRVVGVAVAKTMDKR
ncbi:hypothetical protein SERLA73DRAFT_192470 [Serpula lacrymans var. lacrymans S7.3]|uniref:Uncharacterized protein n=2 Tax=Serpula lacrymans var. lacrymans (strain S7.3) TaxID=936435 RepID=F8QKM1_SERL3|nr:hypothetical protein SERLA73DRAFT_192470 [Serpula lacrymans var. lacrymans S7.3]